ncbi:Stealth protein CR2, conserved region 2, putative [Angomonas deanei]|uniref:Stealth protein CR2, conserved region 2, putative n=1 Tax=Angomonas deanei TaxID=59799 RepID=A0A7G2CLQ4_9TRYP|nr:Stealth protein CR2, conserved region 2, putative [Angomonas deanei]
MFKRKPKQTLDEEAFPSTANGRPTVRRGRPALFSFLNKRKAKRFLIAFLLFSVVSIYLIANVVNSILNAENLEGNWYEWWWRKRSDVRQGVVVPPKDKNLRNAVSNVFYREKLFSKEELQDLYANMSLVYTYLDDTDMDHRFRRVMRARCELQKARTDLMAARRPLLECSWKAQHPPFTLSTLRSYIKNESDLLIGGKNKTGGSVYEEVRYSLRSVEAHMPWHNGRLFMVVPATPTPRWLNQARNFLHTACEAPVRGAHGRLVLLHQNALLPNGRRVTFNTNTVEKYLWRIHNLTDLHLYFNDDYFVNRRTGVEDFVNARGGPYLRSESAVLKEARRSGTERHSWQDSAAYTNLFNIYELDIRPYGEVNNETKHFWRTARTPVEDKDEYFKIGFLYPAGKLPGFMDLVEGKRMFQRIRDYWFPPRYGPRLTKTQRALWASDHQPRYYVAHAPYVYCTAMHRYLERRFVLEYAAELQTGDTRSSFDLLPPFLHHAFVMERPWEASAAYLDQLFLRHTALRPDTVEKAVVYMDNHDGCAPAVELIGTEKSGALYAQFTDDLNLNRQTIDEIERKNPLFFNINDMFRARAAGLQMLEFLQKKFTKPFFLEQTEEEEKEDKEGPLYTSLMSLPIIVLTTYREGVCGAVRSLQFALPDHSGVVQVFHDSGEAGSLGHLRELYNYKRCSVLPAVRCRLEERTVVVEEVIHVEKDDTVLPLVGDVLKSVGGWYGGLAVVLSAGRPCGWDRARPARQGSPSPPGQGAAGAGAAAGTGGL